MTWRWTGALSATLLASLLSACGPSGEPGDAAPTPTAAAATVEDSSAAEASAAAAAAASAQAAASEEAQASAAAEAEASAQAEREKEEREKAEKEKEEREEAERKEAEAALKKERLDPATYQEIDRRAWAQVVRDPDSFVSDKYVVYGYVTQFDSATGVDTFRANTDAVWFEDWYDYDHNTLIAAREADLINDVLQEDVVRMHVEIVGAHTYDTQIGGSTTVPLLVVNIIEIISSSLD